MKYTTKSIVNSTQKQATKPVSNPIAPIGTMCEENETITEEVKNLNTSLDNMRKKYKLEYYCCMFLIETGCRISEALNIKYSDIDQLGRVYIKGLKNSKNRICVAPQCREFLLFCRQNKTDVFQRLNRFHIYRICKKFGIGGKFGGNKKNSITHYFRHINALITNSIAPETSLVQEVLGHKNAKSTGYYLKEKR